MKKKNQLMKTLFQAGIVLGLLGGTTLPVLATVPVAAETAQIKIYELTAEEKSGIEEYIHAKLRVEMQEFYETVLKEMLATAPEIATKAWEEEIADIEKTLTPEQLIVLKDIQQTFINSISRHYHYLLETQVVVGGYGIQEAKDIVAKYEAEEDEEDLAPEVELAIWKYTRELMLEAQAKHRQSQAMYADLATKEEEKLTELFLKETTDLEAVKGQVTVYGQAFATASRPEFPFDFTWIDQRIEELTHQLTPKPGVAEGTGGSGTVPTDSDGQEGSGTDSNNQSGGTGETNPPENNTTGNQVKILPKTSSNHGLFGTVLGFLVASVGILLISKRKTARK